MEKSKSMLQVLEENEEKKKKRPKVVIMCGSSRFIEVMAVCGWLIERDERAITMGLHLLPNWYFEEPTPHHLAEKEGVAKEMDELHLRKIDLADEVFVVDFDYYIGDSTRREIDYATVHNKKIRWFTKDAVGEKVNNIVKRLVTEV